MPLIAIIVLVILLGGGFGYYGHTSWGPHSPYGFPSGVGLILLILLILWMAGGLRS